MTATRDRSIRYLPRAAVDRLLPAIEHRLRLVEAVYRDIRNGTCQSPATPEISPRGGALARAMPAYVSEGDVTAVKWITENKDNPARGLPLVAGLIVVNDSETGLPLAIMDATAITVARTAAASTACVCAFASPAWSIVGIIGYGVQARAHIAAIAQLNAQARFQVFSRHSGTSDDPRVHFVRGTREAVDGADILITGRPLGTKLEPPVSADWLMPSALVLPLDDEVSLPAQVVNDCALFLVDDRSDFQLRREAGVFKGWRDPDDTVPRAILAGRQGNGTIVCANQGMGALDALFARCVLEAAEDDDIGVLLPR